MNYRNEELKNYNKFFDDIKIKKSTNGTEFFLALILVTIFMIMTPVQLFALQNNAPVAIDDSITGEENREIILTVSDLITSNDSDIDGDTLTFLSVSNPTNGTVTLKENGTISFIPDENFSGEANFEYTIVDRVAIDTTIPMPVINLIDSNNSLSVTTDNPKSEINGTCEAGYTVTIQIDTIDIAPTALCSEGGNFSIIPNENILEDTHAVTATQISTYNRVSLPSTSKELIIDIVNPDYSPTLSLRNSIVTSNPSNFTLVVAITDFIDGSSSNIDGNLTFTILKMTDLELIYNPTETSLGGKTVENNLWQFSETDDRYIWTYIGNDGLFPPYSRKKIGISGIATPPSGTNRSQVITVTINSGTGETKLSNNTDSETMNIMID